MSYYNYLFEPIKAKHYQEYFNGMWFNQYEDGFVNLYHHLGEEFIIERGGCSQIFLKEIAEGCCMIRPRDLEGHWGCISDREKVYYGDADCTIPLIKLSDFTREEDKPFLHEYTKYLKKHPFALIYPI